jgi:hypothetical protein
VILAVAASPTTLFGRTIGCRLLRFFGKYSYGLYVFHWLLLPTFKRFYPREQLISRVGSPLLGQLAFIALATGSSVVVAMLSWHLYEKHFLGLKEILAPKNVRDRLRDTPPAGALEFPQCQLDRLLMLRAHAEFLQHLAFHHTTNFSHNGRLRSQASQAGSPLEMKKSIIPLDLFCDESYCPAPFAESPRSSGWISADDPSLPLSRLPLQRAKPLA